mmetsp:Transcript_8653/g.12568  ORF Transcript_8653/g.12568 Transcript_8653/m.12568 type:complete len:136 (+) Transcript_8653:344-751(+)
MFVTSNRTRNLLLQKLGLTLLSQFVGLSVQFWCQVHSKYTTLLIENHSFKGESRRSLKSLENRFKRQINTDIQLFIASYIRLQQQTRSGWTEETYLQVTEKHFKIMYKRPFRFHNCWRVLKNNPKLILFAILLLV